MKRVVITGAGTINALGHDVPETLEAMREGRCGIGPLEFRDVDRLSIAIGGQVKGFEAEGRFNRQQMTLYDRFTQFTLVAAKEAIGQAGLLRPAAEAPWPRAPGPAHSTRVCIHCGCMEPFQDMTSECCREITGTACEFPEHGGAPGSTPCDRAMCARARLLVG